jgi:uncharacterized glyoxalase superfamily protein PhnB
MSKATVAPPQTLFPGIRYVNASAAIDWLEKTFGFKRQLVVPGANGTVAHAQLLVGDRGMIMLGSWRDDDFHYKMPRQVGGVTQATYLYVEDIDSHFARAKAAGAEIVIPLKSTDYGSREYSARDLEGHLWHFGTYLPEMSAEAGEASS